jgi:hypothetical protein
LRVADNEIGMTRRHWIGRSTGRGADSTLAVAALVAFIVAVTIIGRCVP